LLVDKPELIPKTDFCDYTKFINDTFQSKKEQILSQTITQFPSEKRRDLLSSIRAPDMLSPVKIVRGRNQSVRTEVERQMGSTFNNFSVKPQLLETKLSSDTKFMNLSSGFKQVMLKDKVDMKMVIPVTGYAGHRRGQQS